jgi:hypothetical protein
VTATQRLLARDGWVFVVAPEPQDRIDVASSYAW